MTGRGLAGDAQYVLLTETTDAAQREQINQIRENMMNEAIEAIKDIRQQDFKQQLLQFQMEALRERQSTAQANRRLEEMKKAVQRRAGEFELRCMTCDNFATVSSDFRRIKDAHHVVVDRDFFKRVDVVPYSKPRMFDSMNAAGSIRCSKCGQVWGDKATYKHVTFPLLKIASFVMIDSRERRDSCKRWKDSPFEVQQITLDDLQAQFEGQMEQQE